MHRNLRIATRYRIDVTRYRARIAYEPRIGIAHRAMPARCGAAPQLFAEKRRRDALPGRIRHRAMRARCRIARCRHRAMRDAASRDAGPLRCQSLVAATRRLDSQRVELAADSQTRLADSARDILRLAADSQPRLAVGPRLAGPAPTRSRLAARLAVNRCEFNSTRGRLDSQPTRLAVDSPESRPMRPREAV